MRSRSLLPLAAALATAGASWFAAPPPPAASQPEPFRLIAWNDLGMHCMDSDYSVFSILPPYNTVEAQLIDDRGQLVASDQGIVVTYEAIADPDGSINSSSLGKTNFWTHAEALYGGTTQPDTGLAGHDMPGAGNVPQSMVFVAASRTFRAEGIPITPYDDRGRSRSYPLMRLVARTTAGAVLASTVVVLPVSDEMDCSLCHASGSGPDARPAAGWVTDANFERDYRLNVLRLHDESQAANPAYAASLTQASYDPAGLEATVIAGTPVLCARCHASNALPGTGIQGVSPLTEAVHAGHATVTDPVNGLTLDAGTNRASCYRCHPGSETRCLRGAMGSAVNADAELSMQCQDCHGSMSRVGATSRVGWLEQPNCQACHTGTATSNSGQIRFTSAFDAQGNLRVPADRTFATNADVPAPGFDLYRFSTGHGGLRCEACHGSTHAVFPAAHGNDNLQSVALQGHAGTLVECTACHDEMPETNAGGPHGMHTIGREWVGRHGDAAERNLNACAACHGTDFRGTELSRMHADRTFTTQFGTRAYHRGQAVSCYDCHDGPISERPTRDRAPIVQSAAATVGRDPVAILLPANDPDGDPLTFRVVQQPSHGIVGVRGAIATYRPDPGFAGIDSFSFSASDGKRESGLGMVRVTRRAGWSTYGAGFAGTAGTVPTLRPTADPVLGTIQGLTLDNPSGAATVGAMLFALEPARAVTDFGGAMLVLTPVVAFLPLSPAGATLPLPLPDDPALIGVVVHAQGIVGDPGANFGVAFTRGVRLVPGR